MCCHYKETRSWGMFDMKCRLNPNVVVSVLAFIARKTLMACRSSFFVLTSLAFLLSISFLYAKDRLAYDDWGNRFEGHRRAEIAGPSFEALSFVRGEPLASQSSPTTLKASFYLPQNSPVFIKAKELITVHFYEMTAKPMGWLAGTNTFGPWKTSDVIDKLGVSLSNIGVLARVGTKRVGSGGEVAALSFSEASSYSSVYEFVFKVKYDVKKATYHVENISSKTQVVSGILTQLTGGDPISILFDLLNVREGQYRLTIDCLYKGRSEGPLRTFVFYHKS